MSERKFQVQFESDGFGWIDMGESGDWYPTLKRYDSNWSGRNTRIIEVTEDDNFLREVTASEILVGWPDRER